MSPRHLDPNIVQSRLGIIRGLLDDLDSVTPVDAEVLERDRFRRHGIERILTQLVEMAVAINGHVVVRCSDGHHAATASRSPSRWSAV